MDDRLPPSSVPLPSFKMGYRFFKLGNTRTTTPSPSFKGGEPCLRLLGLDLELDRIMAAGEVKWARDVIGDPTKRLEEIKTEREMSLLALTDRSEIAKGIDGLFENQIAKLIRATAKVIGLPAARDVQKKALRILDTPIIRNALKN